MMVFIIKEEKNQVLVNDAFSSSSEYVSRQNVNLRVGVYVPVFTHAVTET